MEIAPLKLLRLRPTLSAKIQVFKRMTGLEPATFSLGGL